MEFLPFGICICLSQASQAVSVASEEKWAFFGHNSSDIF